jgi:hypothetical protein
MPSHFASLQSLTYIFSVFLHLILQLVWLRISPELLHLLHHYDRK